MTSRSNARRAGSLLAALGVLLSMFLVASPAQAVPTVTLTASDSTITLGDNVTLAWSASQDTTELTASGAWSGSKGLPNGAEAVTPATTGTFTYTLVAGNDSDPDSDDSVTVTVIDGPITPNPVTFPDDCTVVIPSTPGVTYFVDYGDGDTQELDADTYDGLEFSGGETVTFFAEANDGFTLADGATTEWDYAAADSCFDDEGPIDEGPEYVTTTVECGSVTFTNTTDSPIGVLYGSAEELQPDGNFTVAAGATHTIKTKHAELAFLGIVIGADAETPEQFRIIDVPQDCDGGSGDDDDDDHPTVAPAAGLAAR